MRQRYLTHAIGSRLRIAVPVRVIERLRPLRRHAWLGYAAGLAVFSVAFLILFLVGGLLDDVPFITLFPAILIAALLGGLHVGLVVAILSFIAAWYFFIPPRGSWPIGTFADPWGAGPSSFVPSRRSGMRTSQTLRRQV